MKYVSTILLSLIFLNSSFGQSKINVEDALKAIEDKRKLEENDGNVERVARSVDSFIQDRCTQRKVPPSLAILQDHVDVTTIEVNEISTPAHVKLSDLTVKYVENKFACVGRVKIKSAPLKLDRAFDLPIPHKLDLKKGYWSLRN
jgi:hypothetical protein